MLKEKYTELEPGWLEQAFLENAAAIDVWPDHLRRNLERLTGNKLPPSKIERQAAEITRLTEDLAEAKAQGAESERFFQLYKTTVGEMDDELEKADVALTAAQATIAKMREALGCIRDRSQNPVPTSMGDRKVLDWIHGRCHAALKLA